eukprot:3451616-Pyramimonas_sp.AAC.1
MLNVKCLTITALGPAATTWIHTRFHVSRGRVGFSQGPLAQRIWCFCSRANDKWAPVAATR